jgi:hypothetical protein
MSTLATRSNFMRTRSFLAPPSWSCCSYSSTMRRDPVPPAPLYLCSSSFAFAASFSSAHSAGASN